MERYRQLLSRAYELEALLLLALSRKDVPAGVKELIEEKIQEISGTPAVKKQEAVKSEATIEEKPTPRHEEKPAPRNAKKPHTVVEREDVREKKTDSAKPEFNHFYALEEEDEKIEPVPVKKRRPSFSLNDRFLYTRELFKGDPEAFKNAIDKISTFKNYDEACVYFGNEYSFDPEKSDTEAAFFRMIKNYFN